MVLLLYQYTKCEMNSKAFLLVDIKLSEKKAFHCNAGNCFFNYERTYGKQK